MHPSPFTRVDRILKRSEYLRLSRSGTKLQNRHFIAIFCPGLVEKTRLGITVTKKVGHSAVVRNRIKRSIREYFRLNRHNITGYWDINIVAKKGVADITSAQIFSSLQNIFDRISRTVVY